MPFSLTKLADVEISNIGTADEGNLQNKDNLIIVQDGLIKQARASQISLNQIKIGEINGISSEKFENIDNKIADLTNVDIVESNKINYPTAFAVKKYVDAKIPTATTTNNGQFLRIVNGVPTWVALTNVAEEGA